MTQETTITHPCRFCGQQVYTVSRVSTAGWMLIVVGVLLAPFCVGLALIALGYFGLRTTTVECDTCGAQ